MAELTAKMVPRWRQDGPSWGFSGHLEASLGVILAILEGLGRDLCTNGRSWGVLLEALGAILGRLGQKLGYPGRCWLQVGSILAASWDKDGEDEPR